MLGADTIYSLLGHPAAAPVLVALAVLTVSSTLLSHMFFGKKTSYKDEHIFITGGSQGIGLALAEEVLRHGARVTLIARSKAKLQAAETSLTKVAADLNVPCSVFTHSADVTLIDEVQAALSAAEAANGPVGVVICNAGSSTPGLFLEQDVSVFEKTNTLNYLGTVNTLKVVLPGMVERNRGHAVLVSSIVGVLGFVGYSSYAPTKYAVRGLADCLRNELSASNIKFSVAYPPDTLTPGYEIELTTMPEAADKITNLAGESKFTPAQVAKGIVKGMQAGAYHLPGPDLGLNLLVGFQAGFAPRMYNFILELILAPVFLLLIRIAVPVADGVVRKVAKSKQ